MREAFWEALGWPASPEPEGRMEEKGPGEQGTFSQHPIADLLTTSVEQGQPPGSAPAGKATSPWTPSGWTKRQAWFCSEPLSLGASEAWRSTGRHIFIFSIEVIGEGQDRTSPFWPVGRFCIFFSARRRAAKESDHFPESHGPWDEQPLSSTCVPSWPLQGFHRISYSPLDGAV